MLHNVIKQRDAPAEPEHGLRILPQGTLTGTLRAPRRSAPALAACSAVCSTTGTLCAGTAPVDARRTSVLRPAFPGPRGPPLPPPLRVLGSGLWGLSCGPTWRWMGPLGFGCLVAGLGQVRLGGISEAITWGQMPRPVRPRAAAASQHPHSGPAEAP